VPIYSIAFPSFNSDKLFYLLIIACVVVMREIKCVFHGINLCNQKVLAHPPRIHQHFKRRVTFGILWNYLFLYNQNHFASLFLFNKQQKDNQAYNPKSLIYQPSNSNPKS